MENELGESQKQEGWHSSEKEVRDDEEGSLFGYNRQIIGFELLGVHCWRICDKKNVSRREETYL